MKIKLFVMDLDGTLLNHKKEITDANAKAVRKMANAGVIPVIATGRMYNAALKYVKRLGIDTPLITYNGALIKSVTGEAYRESFIKSCAVSGIYKFCIDNDIYFQSYKDDQLYYKSFTPCSVRYEKETGQQGIVLGEDIVNLVTGVPKILAITSGETDSDRLIQQIHERFGSFVDAFKSQVDYVEIVAKDTNKAAAVKWLADSMGISQDETAGIGDGFNDIPMLKSTGLAIVMGNASEQVKKQADVIVSDCEHDGVAEAIYQYILKKD